MRYVVVGAGPAGVTAAEAIRAQDADGEIVLIGGESEPAYSRMAIPYLLSEQITEEGTYLRHDPNHLKNQSIDLRQAVVTAVDTDKQELVLDDGERLAYGRLLLATGSQPIKPPVEGLDQDGVHHCWTLDDARHIAAKATKGSKVVLLGAGFIGCIIMEALVERGVDLTVVEMGDRMVPRMMDQTSGNLIKQWCMSKGVSVHTSTKVLAVEEHSAGGTRFQLKCDPVDSLEADLVVVAAGVRPNISFLQGSGISIQQGVVVDASMQSNIANIYAAGDASEGCDWNTGSTAVHAVQPVAVETARIAALNMCGIPTQHSGSMAMNVLDTLGLVSVSYGQWMGVEGGTEVSQLDADEYRYVKLQFDGDCLVGAITLGMTEGVGVLRGLIQSRIRLGRWKDRLMADPTRIREAYLGCTQSAS